MLPHLLLLLNLLGPGSSLQPRDTGVPGTKEAPGPALARGPRQATVDDNFDEDYVPEGTDPPEVLDNKTEVATVALEPFTMMGIAGQRGSVGPGIPEPASVAAATGASAGPEVAGEAGVTLSTELVPAWRSAPVDLATDMTSVLISTMEAASTEGALSTEALSTGAVATEAQTTQPTATEAKTTQPAAIEARITQPAATKAQTTQPRATETLARKHKALSKSLSTEPTPAITSLVSSVTPKGPTVAAGNSSDLSMKNGQAIPPGSPVAPSAPGASDSIPVRQCLLGILILALVATIFLVCTVVLAVRLSRQTHMYPVRNYSPTEMVCISSLLPDGGEGAPATANGGLSKSQALKAEPGEDREEDDLTLHSFLP